MEEKQSVFKSGGAISVYSSLLSVLSGLIFGFIVLLLVGLLNGNVNEVLPAFGKIIFAGIGSLEGLGDSLYYAVPLTLCGLSIGFAFKTGLFNVGASGQFLVGGYTGLTIALTMGDTFGSMTWVVALIASAIFGGLWGLLPGVLQAYRNVNVVVTTIMMNYIGLYGVLYFVKQNPVVYNALTNQTRKVSSLYQIPKFGLDKIFVNSSVQGGLFIAILVVAIIHIILNKTKLGFELQACGHNADAAIYAGINAKKSIITSMIISGSLAGIAGACLYLGSSGVHIAVVDTIPQYGFDGFAVALLGQSNPIGTAVAGVFFGILKVGGTNMQMYSFSNEIIDIISSSIVYFSALSVLFKSIILKRIKKNAEIKVVGGEE